MALAARVFRRARRSHSSALAATPAEATTPRGIHIYLAIGTTQPNLVPLAMRSCPSLRHGLWEAKTLDRSLLVPRDKTHADHLVKPASLGFREAGHREGEDQVV